MIESFAVVDIDPQLALHKPSCKRVSILVRIKMDFESIITHRTSQRPENPL